MAGWLVAAHASGLGDAYARHLVPAFHYAWRDVVLDALGLSPGERFLDVACGTGAVALAALPVVGAHGAVTAVDVSPGMLAAAERVAAERGATGVTWRLGDVHALPFAGGAFDAVASAHGLPFFDDASAALAEVARVLRAGGRAAVTVWGAPQRTPHEHALALAFARVTRRVPDFFATLFAFQDTQRLRAAAVAAGSDVTDVRVRTVTRAATFPSFEAYWEGMVHGRPVAAEWWRLDRATRDRVRAACLHHLTPFARGAGYAFPMEAHVLTFRRPGGARA